MNAREILEQAVREDVSDIFIVAGLPVSCRKNGNIIQTQEEKLFPKETEALLNEIYGMAGDRDMMNLLVHGDDDFSFAIPGVSRFRVSAYKQRGALSAVIRVITFQLPNPQELGIPEAVMQFADHTKGMILVTGSAGSGKSTTLACLIDRINNTRNTHIITLEDPLEYLHRHNKSIVSQREIKIDTDNYVTALKASLRQSPNIILLGEMRDYETISVAMTAAETGHLLFSTLHTIGAAQTIDRIIDVCPAGAQNQIRGQLAAVLRGVITQQLLPLAVGKGRCAATEILVGTDAVANLIREGKCYQIPSILQSGAALGMHSLNADLARLVSTGRITREAAERCATNKSDLKNYL